MAADAATLGKRLAAQHKSKASQAGVTTEGTSGYALSAVTSVVSSSAEASPRIDDASDSTVLTVASKLLCHTHTKCIIDSM